MMKTVALVLGQTKYLSKHVAQCVLGPSEAVIKLYFLITCILLTMKIILKFSNLVFLYI